MEEIYAMVAFVAAAAFIAALVRLYDTPITIAAIGPFLTAFGSSFIAAALALWMLDSDGGVSLTFATFVVVAGSAVGGMAFVRALLEQVRPKPVE